MFINNPLYIISVLLLLVVFAEWLGQQKFFNKIGSSLLVIIAGAVVANFHLIPSSQNASPVYDGIFTYIGPLAIFYLLLDVKLKDIKLAGMPMLLMFSIGAFATIAGMLIGYHFIEPQNHGIQKAFAVAGMYTGTYIGGSANLNAIALQYEVTKNGTLFAAINAADNIITTVWIILTMAIPPILQRYFPRKKLTTQTTLSTQPAVIPVGPTNEKVTVIGFSLLLALGVGSMFLSNFISGYLPAIPSILILTTIALLLAQVGHLQKVKGGKILGFLFVLLFLAVVGAYCDLAALIANKEIAITLLIWVTVVVFVHGLFIFSVGAILKQDWYLVSIASNANIGGATSAAVLATSFNRSDLRLPGILVGSIGNALGTYLGIMVAEYLK